MGSAALTRAPVVEAAIRAGRLVYLAGGGEWRLDGRRLTFTEQDAVERAVRNMAASGATLPPFVRFDESPPTPDPPMAAERGWRRFWRWLNWRGT